MIHAAIALVVLLAVAIMVWPARGGRDDDDDDSNGPGGTRRIRVPVRTNPKGPK